MDKRRSQFLPQDAVVAPPAVTLLPLVENDTDVASLAKSESSPFAPIFAAEGGSEK
jgi:hypothetical protein